MRIREIAHARPRFGYLRICLLLRREGWVVNHKRVRRLYRMEGLQVRMRVRWRKHRALHRGPAPVAAGPVERWSMDFVHDALADGRPFRILTDVVVPRSITVDHGTEIQSRSLEYWPYRRGVQLDFTRPGKPTESAYIESFNGRLRDECLNVQQFDSIADARRKIEALRTDYNELRPHRSLGDLTPDEFIQQGQVTTVLEVADSN